MPPPCWEIDFPHIRDAILDCVFDDPDDDIVKALRAVNGTFRDVVDSRIVKHAVYVLDPPSVHTYIGRVRLAFTDGAMADRTQILDVRPGRCLYHGMEPKFTLSVYFRRLRYARVFNANCERNLPKLIGANPNLTVIYASLDVALRSNKPVGNHSLGATRTITLLPVYMGYAAISTTAEPQTLLDARAVFAFVQHTSSKTDDEVIFHYSPWANIIQIGVRYHPDEVRECTLAGLSEPEWGFVGEMDVFENMNVGYYDWEGGRTLNHGPAVRRISWKAWRQELTEEEWELIASIPDHPGVIQ